MANGEETPGMGPQQEPTTHDLLAARRARRPDGGEDAALIRRAEAAEAAARELEGNLATLQRRLAELGSERERLAERLSDRELEVRNVKQREYAEQQLRVEAESRTEELRRETQSQMAELRRRLDDTERRAAELAGELEAVRHELSEAHQSLAVAERSRERELQSVCERNSRLVPIVRELMRLLGRLRAAFAGELGALREELMRQAAREREAYERELSAMGAQVQSLRIELTGAVAELRSRLEDSPVAPASAAAEPTPAIQRAPVVGQAPAASEMADALAAAVERLRARAAAMQDVEPALPREARPAPSEELMAGGASAPAQPPTGAAEGPTAGAERKTSRFARWRASRRRRRAG